MAFCPIKNFFWPKSTFAPKKEASRPHPPFELGPCYKHFYCITMTVVSVLKNYSTRVRMDIFLEAQSNILNHPFPEPKRPF